MIKPDNTDSPSTMEQDAQTLRSRFKEWLGLVFERSAGAILRADFPSVERSKILQEKVVEIVRDDAKKVVPDFVAKVEKSLHDRVIADVSEQVRKKIDLLPINAIVRNEVDAVVQPAVGPLVQRAINDTEGRLERIVRDALKDVIDARFSDDELRNMLSGAVDKRAERFTTDAASQTVPKHPPHSSVFLTKTRKHKQFGIVYQALQKHRDVPRGNILLVGPAGSGKTIIAEMLAIELGLSYYFTGPVQSEYKLTGYRDAKGQYQYTAFRQAYQHGGVFLFDEFDACSSQAMVAFNTALSNKRCDFPDGVVEQASDFICIAAANTPGTGATLNYSGRERLDGATLDRFSVLEIEYDENLERALSLGDDAWVSHVQKIRSHIGMVKPGFIVSMRASIEGARLRARRVDPERVEEMVLWRGRCSPKEIDSIRKLVGYPPSYKR